MNPVARVWKAAQMRVHRHIIDRNYDRESGVETKGVMFQRELSFTQPSTGDQSHYEATPVLIFERALDALKIDPRRFAFIDIGSGKGRVLLLAARKPFLKVIGIELADNLHQVAVANIARVAPKTPTVSIQSDAATFEIPNEPFVLYLFNSFGGDGCAQFLANVERSLKANPREGYIIYVNAIHGYLFDRQSFLARIPRGFGEWMVDRIVSPWQVAIYRTTL